MAAATSGAPFRALLLGVQNEDGTITGVASGTSQGHDCSSYPYLAIVLDSSAALSSGTLIAEEADYDPDRQVIYSGTWSQIASYTLSSVFASAGGQAIQHLQPSRYPFVRVRLSVAAVGGLLKVGLIGC